MSEKKVNIAWVSGAYYIAKPILDKIKDKVKGLDPFICNSDTPFNKLFTVLNSNDCFSTNKFVLVYGLPDMTDSEKKKFKNLIENMPEDVLLVFFMIDPSSEKAIFSSVEKVGRIYNSDTSVSIGNAKDWIDKRLRGIAIRQGLTDEWKERGIGNLKLLRHKVNHKIRLVMRQEKTLKPVANFLCKNSQIR